MLSLIWVQLGSFNGQNRVDDDVFYSCHEVLLNLDPKFTELFIKVILKSFKSKGISILMLSVIITIFLKTVIGEMDIIVFI